MGIDLVVVEKEEEEEEEEDVVVVLNTQQQKQQQMKKKKKNDSNDNSNNNGFFMDGHNNDGGFIIDDIDFPWTATLWLTGAIDSFCSIFITIPKSLLLLLRDDNDDDHPSLSSTTAQQQEGTMILGSSSSSSSSSCYWREGALSILTQYNNIVNNNNNNISNNNPQKKLEEEEEEEELLVSSSSSSSISSRIPPLCTIDSPPPVAPTMDWSKRMNMLTMMDDKNDNDNNNKDNESAAYYNNEVEDDHFSEFELSESESSSQEPVDDERSRRRRIPSCWFSYKYQVPSLFDNLPKYITYEEFVQHKILLQQQQQEGQVIQNHHVGFDGTATTTTIPETTFELISYTYSNPYVLYEFAFETSSTELALLTTRSSLLVLFILVMFIRSIKNYLLIPTFQKWGTHAARKTHGHQWESIPSNQIRIAKFGEYCYRLCYHTSIATYGIYHFYLDAPYWESYLPGTMSLFREYPYHIMPPNMIWYYLFQAAYNIDAFVSLLELSCTLQIQNPIQKFNTTKMRIQQQQQKKKNMRDKSTISSSSSPTRGGGGGGVGGPSTKTKRGSSSTSSRHKNSSSSTKRNNNNNNRWFWFLPITIRSPILIGWSSTKRGDFLEMLIHHTTTNILIFVSSACRLTRTGSMVFLVHDVSDVPIDMSKLANFLRYKTITISCFIIMVFVWILTRLYLLPFYVLRSVYNNSYYLLEEGSVSIVLYMYYRHFFISMLSLLILLHITWFLIFCQIFQTLIVKHECHDYSEHKFGEEQQQQSQQQQSQQIQIPKQQKIITTSFSTNNNNQTAAKAAVAASNGDDHDDDKNSKNSHSSNNNNNNHHGVGGDTPPANRNQNKKEQ